MGPLNRKGTSPLIAAVVLVAIVIVLGNIVGSWFMDFAGETTEGMSEMGGEEVDCAYAGLRIVEVDTGTDNITLDVENTGDINLSYFRAQLLKENDTSENLVPKGSERVLEPGNLMVFLLGPEGGTEGVNEIEFYSKNCTERSRTVTSL